MANYELGTVLSLRDEVKETRFHKFVRGFG